MSCNRCIVGLIVVHAFLAFLACAAHAQQKTESFDRDPQWEGFNNRMKAPKPVVVTQNFGFSNTNHAGKAAGEIGGEVQRAMTPAYYADKIEPKTLNDHLTCSGTFAFTSTGGSGGVFIGFFNDKKAGASGRPTNSLGLNFDCQGSGGRLAVMLITANNKVVGNFVTPYIPGTYRPTPIKADGSVHYTWKLDYDPAANNGNGQFTFTVKGDGAHPANFENRRLVVDVPEELRKDATTFNRFGMMNMLVDGGVATPWFDDLSYNGKTEDFSKDPGWDASGNRTTYTETEPHGIQNFGYSDTAIAGGSKGEVGGIVWREPKGGYYADRVGPLSMEDRIEASGRVNMVIAGTDADMRIGFFNSRDNNANPKPAPPNFLGVKIGGPTRVGHYFLPEVITSKGTHMLAEGTKTHPKAGPIMVQNQATTWTLLYDPKGNNGNGSMRVTLGDESVVLDLKPGVKADGAAFDRFGILAIPEGGHHVKIYLDDLKYTSGATAPR